MGLGDSTFTDIKKSDLELLYPDGQPGFLAELLHSTAYSGVQMPAEGVTQLANRVLGTGIGTPDWVKPSLPAPEGSPGWWGQQLGGGIGLLAPYLASRFVLRKTFALSGKNAIVPDSDLTPARALPVKAALKESFGAGLMVGGLLVPCRGNQGEFWKERSINALSTGLAFTTMTGLSRLPLGRLSSPSLPARALHGTLSGLSAGIVDVETRSLLSGQGLASGARLREVLPGYAACGGVLSLLPAGRAGRPGQGKELSGSMLTGSEALPKVLPKEPILPEPGLAKSNTLPENTAATSETLNKAESGLPLMPVPAGRRIPVTNGYFDIRPDGSVYEHYNGGSHVLHRPDGSLVEYNPLGISVTRLPDGSSVRRNPGGETIETHPGLLSLTKRSNGTTEIAFADGHRYVNRSGQVEHIGPDGMKETYTVRGVRLINRHGGETVIVNEAGKTICRIDAADIVTSYKDGSFRVEHFDGSVTEVSPNGGWVKYDLYSDSREIGFPDGSRIIEGRSGSGGQTGGFD